MKVTFKNCARCGETHKDLEFEKLEEPMTCGRERYTHWAPCPTNGQPIMLLNNGIDGDKYPEHALFESIQNEAEIIGPFMDWLRSEKGIVLHQWREVAYEGSYGTIKKTESFVSIDESTRELLAEYYGIDYEAYRAEKDAMLEEVRALQNGD